ncbi:MAG: Rieske 2Fe-2S domain-containing protein [Verrucomicrobia bacterium]|nr:Rieske 2Fe-2S domain-containing protein [Verrucomicrobiota bacterium]
MSAGNIPPDIAEFFRAASLADLRERRMITVRGDDRPLLLCSHEGKVFALDNRCPHMGFPLSKGSIEEGILTCHWHHARFDLRSGCTFDLWADDAPTFEVRVNGDDIWVSRRPRQQADSSFYFARLERGMEQSIGLVQAKNIVALLARGERPDRIVREIAKFGAHNHRVWIDGMTTLTAVARLSPWLSETTLVYALTLAARKVAANCDGQPVRHSPGGLRGEIFDDERLKRWMFHWAKVRHDDGAERTVLAALDSGLSRETLNELIFGSIQERIYADGGHALDLANKAFELLDLIGWEHAAEIVPLIVEYITQSQSEEERGAWRAPRDLIALIREAEEDLRKHPLMMRPESFCRPDFYRELLEEDPCAILSAIAATITDGVSPLEIVRHLTLAAAWRLARFAESNDIDDWFGPMHTFSFCNALCQVIARGGADVNVLRGMYHAAMSIYVDRFLNIPRAQLPGETPLERLPTAPRVLREGILSSLDQRKGWSEVPSLVVRYLRLGHPEPDLVDTLTFAIVREDLDFHELQVIEAAVTQAQLWRPGSSERELLYTAVARHLAAHCPTRRSSSQSVSVALRLHQGEEIYSG